MAYVKAADREHQIVAAAIRVLSTVGVAGTTLRAVAGEAGIPLGTLHYVFASRDLLLRAVIRAVGQQVLDTVRAGIDLDHGVEHALRQGLPTFWAQLVESDIGLQIMQYELAMYSARSGADSDLALLQYEGYTTLLAEFCEQAAHSAGERCAVDFATLGRLILAMTDGLILQYIASADADRARRDLDRVIDLLVGLADPRVVAPGVETA